MLGKNSIEGNSNVLVGGDLILRLPPNQQVNVLKRLFEAADERFKSEISETGKVFRISREIDFSAEKLFTSLMQLGIPLDVALRIPSDIIDFLREVLDERQPLSGEEPVSTADIRIAVVRSIEALPSTDGFSAETSSMWAAAYIRRYGNPENDFVKVLDHGAEIDLDYDYLSTVILPHILARVLGLPRESAPERLFSQIFNKTRIGEMSTEIMRAVNTLNLYTISYKTLLFLVQDLVVEPPHPWLVNGQTRQKVVEYNIERMMSHYAKLSSKGERKTLALLHHAYQEFFRHSGAAILALYGAFLGVGSRYGLAELIRVLGMQRKNLALWSFCEIHCIEDDLIVTGTRRQSLSGEAQRAMSKLSHPARDGKHLVELESTVEYFLRTTMALRDLRSDSRDA